MQGITHLLTGILIQKSMENIQPVALRYTLITLLAIISHIVLDMFAKFTYHPSKPLLKDVFWITWHSVILIITGFIVLKYWNDYKFGMIISVIPDIEWVIIHLSTLLSVQIPFYQKPIIHGLFDSISKKIFPLKSVPGQNLSRAGIVLEIILILILGGITYLWA